MSEATVRPCEGSAPHSWSFKGRGLCTGLREKCQQIWQHVVQFLVVLQLSVVHSLALDRHSLFAFFLASLLVTYISSLKKITEEPGGGSPACPFFAEG